ncbi:MAG: sulfatase-like hydrolase/transferase, partial [Bdellovibrionales bacterium]|nr:sulfatase-like hydrolase/transferase [Bdellovibrionales bacterium]
MKNTLRFVMARFLSLVFIYFLIRVFYQVYNHASFESVPLGDLFAVYLSGTRFDISAILKLNAIFFVIWLIPHPAIHSGLFAKILNVLFLSLNIVFIFAGAADAELIHFSGQRLTLNYFAIAGDIENQIGQLIQYYWLPTLITCTIAALFVWIPVKSPTEFQPINSSPLRLLTLFLFTFFIALGVRGGFQNKPLRPAHAFTYSNAELGQLALNSTFTILQSSGKKAQNKISFMPESEVEKHLIRDRTPHFKNFWPKKQNVVIIIVESLALEYMGAANDGHGYTPFIDSLAQKGVFFTNAFANGRRSLEAVPSILASAPSLLNDPFLTSSYQGSKVIGLGQILTSHGYTTSFFHGAVNGSMF